MKSRVVIESGKDRNKIELLDAALDEAGLERLITESQEKSNKAKDEFSIVIKPNLAMFFGEKIIITDPELVEHLVDRIHNLGYTKVVVGEAQNAFSKWLKNREMNNIARTAGYKFCTLQGRAYDVIDLAEDTESCDFPPEFSLVGIPISRIWQKADFRISFAKNKTHEEYWYTLCLKNLLGAIAKADKHLHYHSRLNVYDVCLEIYQKFPVHFNIIDAYDSSQGNIGAQMSNPNQTKTIIAGDNTILVDWVGALKMGVDPYYSPLNKKALLEIGLPDNYEIIGDLSPYKGWKNCSPFIADSLYRLDDAETLRHIMWPASFTNNAKLFPWIKWRYKFVNRLLSPIWAKIDSISIIRWLFIAFNYSVVLMYFILRAWGTIFHKRSLKRKELPINLSIDMIESNAYESLPAYIRPYEITVDAIPKKNGICHAFSDKAIVFYMERTVDIQFEDFISRVDICDAVSQMKDYIGGKTVKVDFDKQNRCVHQIERTVYLPQPNLLTIFNAKDIDLTKIEWITYENDFHKIIWKKLFSDTHTANYDDGAIVFERDDCRTKIRILVRQEFPFPYVLRWLKLHYMPRLRRWVMVSVYRHFFNNTIDNYLSVAEGLYKPIGNSWIPPE